MFLETNSEYLPFDLKNNNVLTAGDGKRFFKFKANSCSVIITGLALQYDDGDYFLGHAEKIYSSSVVIIKTTAWSVQLSTLVHKLFVSIILRIPSVQKKWTRLLLYHSENSKIYQLQQRLFDLPRKNIVKLVI